MNVKQRINLWPADTSCFCIVLHHLKKWFLMGHNSQVPAKHQIRYWSLTRWGGDGNGCQDLGDFQTLHKSFLVNQSKGAGYSVRDLFSSSCPICPQSFQQNKFCIQASIVGDVLLIVIAKFLHISLPIAFPANGMGSVMHSYTSSWNLVLSCCRAWSCSGWSYRRFLVFGLVNCL